MDIICSNGMVTTVDPVDYWWLTEFNWYAKLDYKIWYAFTRTKRGYQNPISMHRLIGFELGLITEDTPEIDHIDNNGMNNYRSNLRGANRSQNAANKDAIGYTIDEPWRRKKCYKVTCGGVFVGRYETPEEAQTVYERVRKEMYGEFAGKLK